MVVGRRTNLLINMFGEIFSARYFESRENFRDSIEVRKLVDIVRAGRVSKFGLNRVCNRWCRKDDGRVGRVTDVG